MADIQLLKLSCVLGAMLVGGCCTEPAFPRVAARSDITLPQLLERFQGLAPTYRRRVDSRTELNSDPEATRLLRSGNLLDRLATLEPRQSLEVVAWEGRCGGEVRQLVVAVFSADSGHIRTVSEEPLLFVRVQVSQH
jgi:hypothetical protein